MHVHEHNLAHKLRLPVVALLVIGNLFLLSLLPSVVKASNIATQPHVAAQASSNYESPNAVTYGLSRMAYGLGQTLTTVGNVADAILQTCGNTIAQGGTMAATAVRTSATFTGRSIVSGAAYVVRIPGSIAGFVSNAPVVDTVIKPTDNTQIPIIGPTSSALTASAQLPAQPTATPISTTSDTTPAWPIHGEITTLFGVPHWPYQPTHTGLDISDGKAAGTTPITPYRPGRVLEAIRSNTGLGNHIIIDHGGGITSVYGHLNSISIQAGQDVTKATILGYEGSTGASTGTHLHFEIRLNGQPADPRSYISSPL